MDRQIVYPGSIPLETDLLNTNKYAMIGLAKLAAAMMGTTTYLRGLTCTPSSPASMVVNIARGEIYSVQNVDSTAYSSLAADTTNTILKQGIVMSSTAFTLTAPTTAGQSINYLIQVTYSDTDSGATVLPYYNAANPSVAYSGPNNSGTAQNTVRSGVCTVALKAGVAATTGTQTTPSVDTGYTAAWVITVAQGATTVTAANISVAANAPFLPVAGLVAAIQQNTMSYAADTGAANAYVAQFVPSIPTLTDGMRFTFKAKVANTGPSTFAANGGSAYPLYSHAHQALQGGEIIANGLIEVEWNSTLTAWVLCGNSGGAVPVPAATQSNQAVNLGQAISLVTGVIGQTRNLIMSVTTASATATVTADEVIVGSAIGGSQYRIGSFNKTINLGTTGAGGMDTGTAPANGFVAIYAIYNPVSGASALLGVNATSARAPEVYGGANMPTGYTASALISVWPVHSVAGQFAVGQQADRAISIAPKSALNSTSAASSLTALSISAIVPINARSVNLACGVVESSAGTGISLSVAGSASQVGIVGLEAAVSGQTASNQLTLRVLMAVSQTIYYITNANAGTRTISVFGYDF